MINNTFDICFQQEFIYSYPTKYIILNFYIYIILLMIPIVIVHEGIRTLLHILYGGKLRLDLKEYMHIFKKSQEDR